MRDDNNQAVRRYIDRFPPDFMFQPIDAYRGRATEHASPRRAFLSFHAEDLPQVRGFRLMTQTRDSRSNCPTS